MRPTTLATWLRINFCVGAIFDAAVLAPMLSPSVAGRLFGIPDRSGDAGFRYAMFVGAALMAGWTCLLVWAALRPLERRFVALLTLLPVLAGLAGAGAFAVSSGLVSLERMAPTFTAQALLGLSFAGSWLASGGSAARRGPHPIDVGAAAR
jgi:hypothetical protein